MKRSWIVSLAIGVIALGVLLVAWLTRTPQELTDPRAAGITAANFDRIGVGMSANEVNQLFGVPPGDYRSEPGFKLVGPGHIPWTEKARGGRLKIWYVPRYHAEVLFDLDGRVVGKYWHDVAMNR